MLNLYRFILPLWVHVGAYVPHIVPLNVPQKPEDPGPKTREPGPGDPVTRGPRSGDLVPGTQTQGPGAGDPDPWDLRGTRPGDRGTLGTLT